VLVTEGWCHHPYKCRDNGHAADVGSVVKASSVLLCVGKSDCTKGAGSIDHSVSVYDCCLSIGIALMAVHISHW